MARYRSCGLPLAGLLTLMAGCATAPPNRGSAGVDELISVRGAPAVKWPGAAQEGERASAAATPESLTREQAVALAFTDNPRIRGLYAELGIAEADVLDAARLRNPRFGYVDLRPEGGGLSQITRSVTLNFTDLLLAPSRLRLARGDFERARETVGAELLEMAAQVETTWFKYVSAQQIVELRELSAQASDSGAEFAERLSDAGNLPPRALALEQAAASESRIALARAKASALRARTALADAVGISARDAWTVPSGLPAPSGTEGADAANTLVQHALETRLDVAAARREIASREDLAGITRRWRWIGDVEVGYERESDTDGTRLKGPSLAIGVPLFNQNQGGVLRTQSHAEAARARLAALEIRVRNEVTLGLDRVAAARQIAESYRTALVPQREAVVTNTQAEHNYMLVGVPDLLRAKREQLDTYQEYVESVRDYWVARTELRRAAGGRLPDDDQPTEHPINGELP